MSIIKTFAVSTLAVCSLTLLSFFKQQPNCKSLKNGRFYFYSPDKQNNSIITRNGSLQEEHSLKTGDTSLWKIAWLSDCEYTCRYISGLKMESPQMEAFYKSTSLKITIVKTDPDYYVYNALVTSSYGKKETRDTMWLKAKKF